MASFEANFIYLLIGSNKALLIDTGAVADPKAMPLAKTILASLTTLANRPFSRIKISYPKCGGLDSYPSQSKHSSRISLPRLTAILLFGG
jgi:hypothetical protein